jgi:alkylation response protein AidB-like acyl-CoA dehydrogenase
MEHGTAEQQERFLGPIRTEMEIWGQGFSEPDAGSDLAALKTRAVRDGDDWVINGSKTWTTYASYVDWLFVLARTDPAARRHRGITCFIVEANAPGIEIRPIKDIAGDTEFGEVFFTDVRVPAENVLGGVNEGWGVAVMTLAHERVIEACEDIGESAFMFNRLIDCMRDVDPGGGRAADDPLARDTLARLWTAFQGVRLTQHRSLSALTSSDVPPPEASIVKLAWSEVGQRAARLGAELFGAIGGRGEHERHIAHFWQRCYLVSRSFTIYAGTSEILRSVIAERVLGLPRSR